jgi:hypothetical protein
MAVFLLPLEKLNSCQYIKTDSAYASTFTAIKEADVLMFGGAVPAVIPELFLTFCGGMEPRFLQYISYALVSTQSFVLTGCGAWARPTRRFEHVSHQCLSNGTHTAANICPSHEQKEVHWCSTHIHGQS